jgi:hypothetical protein
MQAQAASLVAVEIGQSPIYQPCYQTERNSLNGAHLKSA